MRLLRCLLSETKGASSGTSRLHAILLENDAYKSYSDVWLTATQFLNERALSSSALPAESEEKLLIEALVGAMHQFKPDPQTDPSQQIPGLVAKIQDILGSADTELSKYMRQTLEGLQRLRVQIPDSEEVPDAPPEGDDNEDTASPSKDAAPSKGKEEEQPPSEVQGLASKLGLRDSVQAGPRLMSALFETNPPPKPGEPVITVQNGNTRRRQVVKSDATRTTVIDPDHPDQGTEDVPTKEIGSDQPDGKPAPPGTQPSTSTGPRPPSPPTPPRYV